MIRHLVRSTTDQAIDAHVTRGELGGNPFDALGTVLLDAVLWSDPVTNFLPAGVSGRITNSAELIGSERTRTTLSGISESFDYIIIDLPPLGAAVDARAYLMVSS
jgi:Mrp family chromosome partitioning ATPase